MISLKIKAERIGKLHQRVVFYLDSPEQRRAVADVLGFVKG